MRPQPNSVGGADGARGGRRVQLSDRRYPLHGLQPSFDPADPPEISDDDSDYEGVYLNRLLSGLYTPGSVFKVVTTAAALEQLPGVEERTFTCDAALPSGIRSSPALRPRGDGSLRRLRPLLQRGVCPAGGGAGGRRFAGLRPAGGAAGGLSVSGIPTVSGLFTAGSGGDLGWSGVGTV